MSNNDENPLNDKRTFGDKLKLLRKLSGKSQKQVVTEFQALQPQVRMSQSTLSALEQRVFFPRGVVFDALCKYYDTPYSYFGDVNIATNRKVTSISTVRHEASIGASITHHRNQDVFEVDIAVRDYNRAELRELLELFQAATGYAPLTPGS